MTLVGKIQGEVELKCDAQAFHDMWTGKSHILPSICSDKCHGCDLHEGEYGKTGAIIEWTYTHDGELKKTKQIIEVDDEKTKIVFKIVGGHFSGDSEDFKDFHITLDTIPNATGGCVARWTFDYEKLDANIADPQSKLQFLLDGSTDIDAHLQKA